MLQASDCFYHLERSLKLEGDHLAVFVGTLA